MPFGSTAMMMLHSIRRLSSMQTTTLACLQQQPLRCMASASKTVEEQLAMPAGAMLKVRASKSVVDILASSGLRDVAELETLQGAWDWRSRTADDGRPEIEVVERTSAVSGSAPLEILIPEKWIGVDVSTQGQHVSVSKVVEANLFVNTNGGDCKLGQIRAYTATVNTMAPGKCGTLKAGELSGSDVEVITGHAPVSIQRLVGQRVHVEVHDRPLSVKSLYGENVNIHTGGGALDIGNLDCSGSATLHTEGGAINIDSLDGNAVLHSSGGDIEVHLHSKVGMVRVGSGGGAVKLAINPQAYVEVTVRGNAPLTCEEDKPGVEIDVRTGERVLHFKPESTDQQPRYGQLSEGRVVVDSGGAEVQLHRVGWMQALQQRMKHAGRR